jgi:putative ATP-dependent endonuclease of the OLD family
LLSRRVLIAEGATEATAFPMAARRLAEINEKTYASLESLGICVVDAGSESQIADLANFYRSLGKTTFAICDKQTDGAKASIENSVEALFMHQEKSIEDLVMKNTTKAALERFSDALEWPQHLALQYPDPKVDLQSALKDYFKHSKGNWGISDFLAQCSENEIPLWIRDACISLKHKCDPAPKLEKEDSGPEIGSLF